MSELDKDNPVCITTLKLMSDFWTMRIIDALSDQQLRFCEIEFKIETINTATLSNRLKKLEDNNLIVRIEKSRADVTYRLSTRGIKSLPILKSINDFALATVDKTNISTT